MQREKAGVYSETRDTLLDGQLVSAEFRVYRAQKKDPENSRKMIELPVWTWDCPLLNIPAQESHPTKAEAIEAMQESCAIGFTTLPVKAVALAVVPI